VSDTSIPETFRATGSIIIALTIIGSL
jgi:hypothetical protein